MKRKGFVLLALIVALVLSGCSGPNIPFLNKDKGDTTSDDQPSDVLGNGEDRVFPTTGLTFHVGDSITVSDLVTIDESQAGNVLQSVMVINGVPTADSYTLDEAGSFTYTVMIEFLDGVIYSGDLSVEVEKVESVFPDELHNNIASGDWSTFNISLFSMSMTESDVSNVQLSVCKNDNCIVITSNQTVNGSMSGNACVATYVPFYNDLPETPLTSDTRVIVPLRALAGWENAPAADEYFFRLYKESTTVNMTDLGVSLYDVNGVTYPLKAITYTVDFTPYGGSVYEVTDFLYTELSDGSVFLSVFDESDSANIGRYDIDNLPEFASYEEYVDYVKNSEEYITYLNSLCEGRMNMQSASRIGRGITSLILFGDVSSIRPSKEPESSLIEVPLEEVEEPVASGVVADIFTPYSARYPQIYTWAEDEIKYRRWVYTIENDTQYLSSIIYPDGTQRISGASVNDDWRLDFSSGQTGTGTTTPDNTNKFSLSSQYARYTITASSSDNVTFDEANSSSGRLSLKYNGKQYYIEAVRPTQIQGYTANCIYPTSGMYNAEYTITQNSDNNRNVTLGVITPYTMKYKDSRQDEQIVGYMAVYNISNDYLCVYGEEVGLDVKDMMDILEKMVTRQ